MSGERAPVESEATGWRARAVDRTLDIARDRADRQLDAARDRASRSVDEARGRALERSQRFISAAMELVQERGTDITVQDVVTRSQSSLRTFYTQFASKDDLLLAVFEEMVTAGVDLLTQTTQEEAGPVDRLHHFVVGLFELVEHTPSAQAMVVFHLGLAKDRPNDFDHALQPMLDMLTSLVAEAKQEGAIVSALEAPRLATLLLNAVVMSIHVTVLTATSDAPRTTGAEMWEFCCSGLGVMRT